LKWPAAVAALILAVAGGWLVNSLQRPHVPTIVTDVKDLKDREKQLENEKLKKAIEDKEKAKQEEDQKRERDAKAKVEQRRTEIARTKERLRAIVNLGDAALKQHAEMLAEQQAWVALFAALPTNDQGRRLASSDSYVRTYKTEREKTRHSVEELQAMRSEIDLLLQPVRDADASPEPAYAPPNELDMRIIDKRKQIDAIANEYRKSRQLIEGLVAASNDVASTTLAEKLDALAAQDAKLEAEKVARETADIRDQLSSTKARAEREKLEAENRQREAAIAAGKLQAEEDRQHATLVAEAKSAKVKTALAFFAAKGYWQPLLTSMGTEVTLQKTTDAQPISLALLRSSNVLDKNGTSLKLLHTLICRNSDEARSGWPQGQVFDSLSTAKLEELKQIQDYLNRLGPVLVELGLLSP
jgi:hypothetical protein